MTIDFDSLSKKAFAPNAGIEEKNESRQAAFALDKWILIMRGEMRNVHPYIAQANQIQP